MDADKLVYHDFRFIRNIKEGPSPGEKTVVQLVATVHICKLNPPSPQHFTTDCYKIVPKTVAQIGNQTGRRKRHVRQNFKQTLRLTICDTVVGTILTVCFTLIFTLSHRPWRPGAGLQAHLPSYQISCWSSNQQDLPRVHTNIGLVFAPHHVTAPRYILLKRPSYFNSRSWQNGPISYRIQQDPLGSYHGNRTYQQWRGTAPNITPPYTPYPPFPLFPSNTYKRCCVSFQFLSNNLKTTCRREK